MIEDEWFQCIYYIVSWVYSINWQTENLGSGQVNVIFLRKEGKKQCPYLLSEALYVWVVKNVCVTFFPNDFEILNDNLKH